MSENVKIKKNKIIILPLVLHECEPWSLTLRKETGAEDSYWKSIIHNQKLRELLLCENIT